jgi:hypothetical protein
MNKLIVVSGLFLLASCTHLKTPQSPEFDQSEVQSGIFLTCNGYKPWKDCYAAAEKACPSGYSVISKDENHVMQARTLRIECKK